MNETEKQHWHAHEVTVKSTEYPEVRAVRHRSAGAAFIRLYIGDKSIEICDGEERGYYEAMARAAANVLSDAADERCEIPPGAE